jgi:hypothetical protein
LLRYGGSATALPGVPVSSTRLDSTRLSTLAARWCIGARLQTAHNGAGKRQQAHREGVSHHSEDLRYGLAAGAVRCVEVWSRNHSYLLCLGIVFEFGRPAAPSPQSLVPSKLSGPWRSFLAVWRRASPARCRSFQALLQLDDELAGLGDGELRCRPRSEAALEQWCEIHALPISGVARTGKATASRTGNASQTQFPRSQHIARLSTGRYGVVYPSRRTESRRRARTAGICWSLIFYARRVSRKASVARGMRMTHPRGLTATCSKAITHSTCTLSAQASQASRSPPAMPLRSSLPN